MALENELTVDDGYKNIRIRIDGNIVADQDIIDNITINYGCTDGSAPAFGTTFSPHCEVTINSNEIIGNSALNAIVMGAIFVVECELHAGVYKPLGRFEINQPVQYTDDYMISFSGEGMLGSVLGRKKMDWSNMDSISTNSKKGILTLSQALGLVHSQFPNVTIELPDEGFMPPYYENIKIVVPLRLNKWKKKASAKKRFVKLTVRDFIAGIAVMLCGNVVEFGNSIRIITISEAWNNESGIEGKFFTADSYMADYTTERVPYAPKSLRLKTYVTLPVTTSKKGSSTKTVHGYCYEDECECGSIYDGGGTGINKYDVYVDCQWIGRSFEAFYFNDGDVSDVKSGDYEDDITSQWSSFNFTPISIEFSGWNDIFEPAHFIKVRTIKKNTATQEETEVDVLAYIADMTFTWNGTISVLISSSYNGEAGEVTVTIGDNQASSAWNNGTNIPEFADVVYSRMVFMETTDWQTFNTSLQFMNCVVVGNELHIFFTTSSGSNTRFHWLYDGTGWYSKSSDTATKYKQNECVYQGQVHRFYNGGYAQYINYTHKVWNGSSWSNSFNVPIVNDYYVYVHQSFEHQGYLYITATTNNSEYKTYRWDGISWEEITPFSSTLIDNTLTHFESNGVELHAFVMGTGHYVYDGTTFVQQSTFAYHACFYQGDLICILKDENNHFMAYGLNSDELTELGDTGYYNSSSTEVVVGMCKYQGELCVFNKRTQQHRIGTYAV